MVSLDSIIGEMSYTSMAVWPRIRVGVGVAIHWTGLGAVFVPPFTAGVTQVGTIKNTEKQMAMRMVMCGMIGIR